MKTNELKLKMCNFFNHMIDTYYGNPNVGEKMINYTLKVIVKNNMNKVDSVLKLFETSEGEINAEEILQDYKMQMGNEKITFDLRNYINQPLLKNMLPDKALVISAEDISKILNAY